jgi:4-aminobutyrate aminotransferase-like enzyme
LATLEVIDEENIQQRAKDVGGYFKSKLLELQDKFALIGDIRGMGLLLAIELVEDRKTKQPATERAKRVVERLKTRRVLVGKSGSAWNTIRFAPPMCVSKVDVDYVIDALDLSLAEVARET